MTHLLSEDHFEEAKKISGDLLTATIWSWFAASESHNRLSQKQANMVENPGLFHAVALPVYGWGVVRQVKFPGVNLDIGRVRATGWARDNNRQKWIGYNRLRGQYMSALEHAIPERFFNDPAQCNAEGSTTRWAHGSSPFIVSSGQAMDCGCLLARAQASDLRFRSCRGS